jgi:signal transduction histidine kinase/DNA-binding response OmpR family regulator
MAIREKAGTVLVVDDLDDARELVSVVLSAGGYRVIEAATGTEALARLRDAPDVVVLDVHLPDIDGFEVCRRIKTNPQSATTPVVQVSAVFSRTEHRVRGLSGGADAYITKPFEPELLVATVDALMRLRVAERALSISNRALRLEYEITRILAERTSASAMTTGLLGSIAGAVSAHVAELWRVDTAAQVMVREGFWHNEVIDASLLDEASAKLQFRRGEGLAGGAWASGRTEWVGELTGRTMPGRIAALESLGLRSATVVPIVMRDTLAGAVVLFHESGDRPSEDTLRLAGEVSPRLGLYLEQTQASEALQRAEDQLRQAQKMEAVGRLAGGIAHDFNNLLTVIGGHAQVLVSELPAGNRLRGEADAILSATDRAAALTAGLLAFGRKQVVHPRVLDLTEVIRSMSGLLQRMLGENITVTVEASPGVGRVRLDTSQVEQILMNLAVNARDAMPEGGRLTFELSNAELAPETAGALSAGRYVVLSVTDTGIGMDAETRARLFEPFFTTKPVGQGTGLGLATVYGILKQSGGDVSVESEPGKGASFRMYLPRVDAPVEPPSRPAGGPSPRGTETVLLVEDADPVRQLAATILRPLGYTVLEASNATAAMGIVQAHEGPLNLLITDVVMPGMNGPRLAERLTAVRPDMRVLYVSGYAEDALDLRGRGAFLAKPYTSSGLARKVREVLDSS